MFNLILFDKKFIGMDRYGYKYYYFLWIPDKIFAKVRKHNIGIPNDNKKYKYEWRIIKDEKNIKKLIDNLCEKGIHETGLKIMHYL